jgi:hypothetical protein
LRELSNSGLPKARAAAASFQATSPKAGMVTHEVLVEQKQ